MRPIRSPHLIFACGLGWHLSLLFTCHFANDSFLCAPVLQTYVFSAGLLVLVLVFLGLSPQQVHKYLSVRPTTEFFKFTIHASLIGCGVYLPFFILSDSSSRKVGIPGLGLCSILFFSIAEEIFVSGLLFPTSRQRFGLIASLLFVCMFTVVLHLAVITSTLSGLAIIASTVIFALYREVSANTWPSVVAHASYNAASYVLAH